MVKSTGSQAKKKAFILSRMTTFESWMKNLQSDREERQDMEASKIRGSHFSTHCWESSDSCYDRKVSGHTAM